MDIGKLLKFHRLERKMTQEEVAESIVSVSYLSRIENNKTTADQDTIALLFNRVGINFNELQSEDNTIQQLLTAWEQPLLHNQIDECRKLYEQLNKLMSPITRTELLIEFHVKRIRACIILKKIDEVEGSLNFLKYFYEKINVRSRFYYYKHLGNYYSVLRENDQAKIYFEKALTEYSDRIFHVLEKADLYYLYSLVLDRVQDDSLSLSYANKSLDIFRQHYKLEKCMRIHIQIGISTSKMGNISIAIEEFKNARLLALEYEDSINLGIIEHNIASMYLIKRDNPKAIKHLLKALQYKDTQSMSYITSLNLLIYIYYREQELNECQRLLRENTKSVLNLPKMNIATMEFWFLYYFIEEDEEKWEVFAKEKFFPQLKKMKLIIQIQRYANLLGEYYQAKGAHKKASICYKLVIDNNYISLY
ncbi:helix-turn-helix transcriptional regulator [Exiguobacterium sp. s191]|uniref:helix-turn-helix domain-containing protein n=1 Tax=Exiguobacterium sp. s191 TaxID=2751196 RepID=UPI001BE7C657|nr:helix-turn-helix transcriptional regulator [Exiguobacterium sp. s191]